MDKPNADDLVQVKLPEWVEPQVLWEMITVEGQWATDESPCDCDECQWLRLRQEQREALTRVFQIPRHLI